MSFARWLTSRGPRGGSWAADERQRNPVNFAWARLRPVAATSCASVGPGDTIRAHDGTIVPAFLTADQAGCLSGLSGRQVRRMIEAGVFPGAS